jgi:hypothetical protein
VTPELRELVEYLRERYPAGTRVALLVMDNPYTKLKPGDKGTVVMVDDCGTIHCDWDSGSKLGVVYGVDCVVLETQWTSLQGTL